MNIKRFAVLTLAISLLTGTAAAENWPSWRGPHGNGVTSETGLPVQWNAKENVAWRFPLPGPGGATPVVWEDKIFVTSVADEDLVLICVSTSGKELWKRVVGKGNKVVRGDEGNSASPSPSTDGKHVWAFFTTGDLACFDMEGEEVWKVDVQERYGKFKIAFGMTASPIVDGERLFLQLIHGEGNAETREATIACLDKLTGQEIWKTGRPSDAIKECEHSYASPTIYRDDERAYLLTHGADYVVAHSLEDGSEIWRCGDLNPKGGYNPTLRFVSSPVCVPGMIVVPSAKNGPVIALKPDGKGDITNDEKMYYWRRPKGTPDVPSPVIHGDYVYLCRENGNLVCVKKLTGEEVYENRTSASRHRASPVVADGKIYLTERNNGIVSVVKEGAEFELLSQNELGEAISASPALSGGRIYLRSFDALYAIGK